MPRDNLHQPTCPNAGPVFREPVLVCFSVSPKTFQGCAAQIPFFTLHSSFLLQSVWSSHFIILFPNSSFRSRSFIILNSSFILSPQGKCVDYNPVASRLAIMTTKFLALISVIGLASISLVQAQLLVPGGSPEASPSPTKHRAHKTAETTASPAEEAATPSTATSPAASPSPGKRRAHKKAEATTAASPAAAESTAAASASPAEKGSHKKAKTEAAASPAPKTEVAASPAPSASPSKFSLGNLFKPKTSASASPVAASPAPAARTTEEAANPPAPGGGHGLVWVNTETHVYHREGSRFYGTTKQGKYMTEQDAIQAGNKAAPKGP